MSHAILAVVYRGHQNPAKMLDIFDESAYNFALEDEYDADDKYYYNINGKFDYVTLIDEYIPFYEWLEWTTNGPHDIYAFLTPNLYWFDRWDNGLGKRITDERFNEVFKHHLCGWRKTDGEDLYVNIYDYHS